jgi:hypothetical protein
MRKAVSWQQSNQSEPTFATNVSFSTTAIICFILLLQSIQADREMENPPLPGFPGRRTETTRHRVLSQRDVFRCRTAKRLTGGSRREAPQSLWRIAPKRQFEIKSSARTRSRLVAEIDGAQATS